MDTQIINTRKYGSYSVPGLIKIIDSKKRPLIKVIQPDLNNTRGNILVLWPSSQEGFSFSINGMDYTNKTGMFNNLAPGSYFVTFRDLCGEVSDQVPVIINKIPLKKAVCIAFDIPEELLFAKTRKREVINGRHCYAYMACKIFHLGPTGTGRIISKGEKPDTNHATVISSCKKFINFYDTERDYRQRADMIIKAVEDGIIYNPKSVA